jgi:hypothetical protein
MKIIENYIYLLDGQFLVKIVWKKYEKACILELGKNYPSAIVDIDRLSGVTLTKEILLKCGAEKYEFDNGQPNQYRIGSRLFVIRNGAIYDYGSGTKLDYLHELQNLYYSLTKTELNYENTISKN